MNSRTPIFSYLALAFTFAGCAGEPPGEELDFGGGDRGAVRISIESAEPPIGELTGRLQIFEAPMDPDEPLVEREFEVRGSRVLDIIYLREGEYVVTAELLDGDDRPVISGTTPDVHVLPGQLTSVSVQLEESGGVHVSVEVPSAASRFEIDPEFYDTDRRGGVNSFVGAQRVEKRPDGSASVVYYGILHSIDVEAKVFIGDTVEEMLTSAPIVIDDDELFPGDADDVLSNAQILDLVVVGEELYTLTHNMYDFSGSYSIFRSHDALEWTYVSTLPGSRGERPGGECGGCHSASTSLLADNQFNVFHDNLVGSLYTLSHVFSRDGERWDYSRSDELSEEISLFNLGHHQDFWNYSGAHFFKALLVGGNYVILYGLRGIENENAFYLYRLSSPDRLSWAGPRPHQRYPDRTVLPDFQVRPGNEISNSDHSSAAFRTPEGLVLALLIRNHENHVYIRLAREVR